MFQTVSPPCLSSKADRWLRCISGEIYYSSGVTGLFRPHPVTLQQYADLRASRYALRSTEKVASQEVGSHFTLKLRSLRTGLPAVKEYWEPSTKLEFDGFDGVVADGGRPEGKGTNQPLSEEVDEGGKGEEGVEDGESESKSRMESKPPAFGEYKWKWKVRNPSSLLVASC